MKDFEQDIRDSVMNAIEEDSPNTVDILDEEDDRADVSDDSLDIVSIATSLSDFASGPIDMDIPDTVDMATLENIASQYCRCHKHCRYAWSPRCTRQS